MLKAVLIIFAFLMAGEMLKYGIGIPIPGNILGMVLIFIFLQLEWIKLEQVKPASDKLLQFLPLFFIPYGVGLMVSFDLLAAHLLLVLGVTVISTILTLYFSGLVLQKLEKRDGTDF